VIDIVHAAAVDRYRRILESGNADLLARKGQAERRGAETPRGVVLTGAQIDFMVERYADRLAKSPRRVAKADVEPIHPRQRDEREYERAIRRVLLRPLLNRIRRGLSLAVAVADAIDTLDATPIVTSRAIGLVEREINRQARRIQGYHRRRLIQTFRAALGVDIRPVVLNDDAIRPLMEAWRRENVNLIHTVPRRLMDDLRVEIDVAFSTEPFNQEDLQRVVREKGKSAGYNLRRITRDQTNKAIGNLTQARHQQLGIEGYTWRTAQDERVRPEHAVLNGTSQRWDEPPAPDGHPGQGIQCRCVAEPLIPEAGIAA